MDEQHPKAEPGTLGASPLNGHSSPAGELRLAPAESLDQPSDLTDGSDDQVKELGDQARGPIDESSELTEEFSGSPPQPDISGVVTAPSIGPTMTASSGFTGRIADGLKWPRFKQAARRRTSSGVGPVQTATDIPQDAVGPVQGVGMGSDEDVLTIGEEPGQSLDDIDWETTRYLAAETQLDLRYAWGVVRGIIGEPFRAVAPAAGADIVVVTRWALAALRRRAKRDAILASLLILGIFTAIMVRTWLPIAVIALLAVVAIAYERWVRDVRILSRLMLRGRFHAHDAPFSPSPRNENRLTVVKQQQKGNLVVFRGRRAFVGSGTNVFHDRILINAALGKKGKGGKRQQPIEFTTPELHEALEAALKDMGFPELRVGERLFVNGEHVAAERRLLPDRFGPPAADAPPELLYKGCDYPTPEARTYLCAEIGGWKGQLVVSLFARAVQANGSLQVEWLFNALPPLHSNLLHIDQRYEQRRIRQFARAAAAGIIWFIPALLSAPVTFARYAIVPITDKIRERRESYRIRNGYVFNYGSPRSIREGPVSYRRAHDFVVGDELTFIYLAEHTMLRALGRFLKAHKVDMKQFDKQAQTLIKKVNKYNVGKVKAGSVAIGNKARVDGGKKSGSSSE